MTRRTLAVVVALAALVGGIAAIVFGGGFLTTGPHVADANEPVQVGVGKIVYERACASCHGANLEGQPDWRTRLPSGQFPAPPHDDSGHTWHHPDAMLFDITKRGGQSVASGQFKSAMPAFGDTLTDAEMWAVLAYIKSRWSAPVRERQAGVNSRAKF